MSDHTRTPHPAPAAPQPQHGHTQHTGHTETHTGPDPHAGHDPHGGHGGHGGHAGHVALYRRLFWTMLVIGIPTVLLSGMFADILGYRIPELPLVGWVSPVLGTIMYVVGGRPFLTGAVSELRSRKPGMMLLVALAITVAFVASWGAQLGVLDHSLDFWWELALLVIIMLLGHWLEMRSLAASSSALDSLAALLPDEAERVTVDATERVAPTELAVGDVVVVRPGGRVPADGTIVSGSAELDESMITGESRPVPRGPGDQVVAGTVSVDSAIRVEVRAVGDQTALAGIQRLVASAQESTSRAQLLADRAAGWLFWFALGTGVLTAVVWSLLGRPDDALTRTITVLVVACPHALGLATPLVVAIATERAARGGVLITDRRAMEAMRTVDVVVFDKTGTLTRGEPGVERVVASAGSEDELLALAAAAESESEHPVARAVVGAAAARSVPIPPAEDFHATTGVGVQASVAGRRVRVGGPALLHELGAAPLPETADWSARGDTVLHVVVDDRVVGALGLTDELRPESVDAVRALRRAGRSVVMITGDAEPVAASVASRIGIERFVAGVRPEGKAEAVGRLQAEGHRVAMVGDGVNDAPALARADVGIAIGAGTDVAAATAGVVLAGNDPRSVLSVIELSQRSYRKMRQNLAWAAGYNLITVPLAAGVLAPIGFVLPMAVGALLMAASTIVVAANAQLLRRLDLRPDAVTR